MQLIGSVGSADIAKSQQLCFQLYGRFKGHDTKSQTYTVYQYTTPDMHPESNECKV
jgi:hypothetical protein